MGFVTCAPQSQLLKGTSQLSHIAAIADSMDFLAAALPKLVGVQDQAANPSQTGPASTNSQWKKSAENSSNTGAQFFFCWPAVVLSVPEDVGESFMKSGLSVLVFVCSFGFKG